MRCNVRRYLGPFVVGENIYYIFLIQEGERHYSEAWYYSLLDQNKWHTIYFIHSDDFITFYPKLFSLPRKLRGGHKHWDGKSTLQMRREKIAFFLKGLYIYHLSHFIQLTLIPKKHSPFLFSRWVREWLGLFARRLSTQSRVQSKFIPGNKFRASYWWGKLSRDDASDDKYRVSRIIELIAIMKYYCHVWRYWSHHDSH